jgi:hypothetical protein
MNGEIVRPEVVTPQTDTIPSWKSSPEVSQGLLERRFCMAGQSADGSRLTLALSLALIGNASA